MRTMSFLCSGLRPAAIVVLMVVLFAYPVAGAQSTWRLDYSSYLGGTGDDSATIAVGSDGHLYIAGTTTSADFPVTRPVQPLLAGGRDLFIAKLTPNGSRLVYSTYLGGSGDDLLSGIAVDAAGNVYIAGSTSSTDFPTANPLQKNFAGGPSDGFVAMLNSQGDSLLYSTFIGGGDEDRVTGVAVDSSGAAYVVGYTRSAGFPTVAALQAGFGGGQSDGFVAKISPGGSSLIYSTFLGGDKIDRAIKIALDAAQNPYVAGWTESRNFPVNGFENSSRSSFDVFVAKLSKEGTSLVFSAVFGGTGSDFTRGMAVDSLGAVYVTGETDSFNFPTVNAFQPQLAGVRDAFVAKLDPSGRNLVYSTFLGGRCCQTAPFAGGGSDTGNSVAVDKIGNAYVTGHADSTDFPTKNALTEGSSPGGFISKLDLAGQLEFSSYLPGNTVGAAVLVDSEGNVWITGTTTSKTLPVVRALQPNFGGGDSDAVILKISQLETLFFAQFADGSSAGTSVSSQITIVNLNSTRSTKVTVEINDDNGNPVTVDLNRSVVNGKTEIVVPASGLAILKTDGAGPLQAGSVVVTADTDVAGFILFSSSIGTAGVGASEALTKFVAPVEVAPGINTGIAVMGLGRNQTIQLELRDQQGTVVARANAVLGAKSHLALFVTELKWDVPPDFSNLSGTLSATGTSELGATVIRLSPGEFATLPVAQKE